MSASLSFFRFLGHLRALGPRAVLVFHHRLGEKIRDGHAGDGRKVGVTRPVFAMAVGAGFFGPWLFPLPRPRPGPETASNPTGGEQRRQHQLVHRRSPRGDQGFLGAFMAPGTGARQACRGAWLSIQCGGSSLNQDGEEDEWQREQHQRRHQALDSREFHLVGHQAAEALGIQLPPDHDVPAHAEDAEQQQHRGREVTACAVPR